MTAKASLLSRIAVTALGCATAIALACALCACSAPASPESAAESALSDYLAKIQRGDMSDQLETIQSQYGSQIGDVVGSDPAAGLAAVNAWVEGFSYELGAVTMDGDDACTIETTITCRELAPVITSSIGKAFTNALGQAFSGNVDQDTIRQQTQQIFIDELGATELASKTITVPMESTNGAWQPTADGKRAIILAMTGDLEALSSQLSSIANQLER